MKYLSIEEAIQKGLLCETSQGIAITKGINTFQERPMRGLNNEKDEVNRKINELLDRMEEIENGINVGSMNQKQREDEIKRLTDVKESYRDQRDQLIGELEVQDALQNLLEETQGKKEGIDQEELSSKINIPSNSIVVSDDEKSLFAVEAKREHFNSERNYLESKNYLFPRVYTPDNSPVCVAGNYRDKTAFAVQNNDQVDISKEDYYFQVKSASGYMYEKATVNPDTNYIEQVEDIENPICVKYEEGELIVTGEVDLNTNQQLPLIDKNFFDKYEFCLVMDGKEYDSAYGYREKISNKAFERGFIKKLHKLKIDQGINPELIECVGFDEEQGKEYMRTFSSDEIQILDPRDRRIEELIAQDMNLDSQIEEKQAILDQLQKDSKGIQPGVEKDE